MQEEGRQILFFVNWVGLAATRYAGIIEEADLSDANRRSEGFSDLGRLGLASKIGAQPVQENNYTIGGAKSVGMDVAVAELVGICLSKNDRRLGLYDGRLLRPRFVPFMVRLARRFIRVRWSAPAPA